MLQGIVTGDVYDGETGYQTCDLYLAAFFLSAGSRMVKHERDMKTKRVYFKNNYCLLNIIAALQPPKPEAVFRQFCMDVLYNEVQMFTGFVTPIFSNPIVGKTMSSFME